MDHRYGGDRSRFKGKEPCINHTSTPSAKRTRHRKNQKNIPAGAWNYIDWEIRKFEEEGIDWEVWVNGELVDPQKVRKRTKEEVPLTLQTLRNHGMSRAFLTQVLF